MLKIVLNNTPVTLGAMTSKNQLQPLNSQWSLPVFSEVADSRAMVSDDPRWSLVIFRGRCDHLVMARYLVHAPNTSPRPNGRREVVGSL